MIEFVEQTLKEQVGGKPFFDKLDDGLSDIRYFLWARNTAYALFGNDIKFVVSGEWGEKFNRWWNAQAVWLPGHLRYYGAGALGGYGKEGERYVFLDNSLYSARTYLAARQIMAPATVVGAVVIYDGRPATWGFGGFEIYSLYRWRDR